MIHTKTQSNNSEIQRKLWTKTLAASTAAAFFVSSSLISFDAAALEDLSDPLILNAVENKYSADPHVHSERIDVKVKHGVVTLTGTAHSILAKERAIATVKSMNGVRTVIDHLKVDPVKRSDEAIETDVNAALFDNPAADGYEIGVTAKDGIVTLKGTVESYEERRLSVDLAKGVRGVKGVKNDIIVKFVNNRSKHEALADVRQRLKNDIWVNHENINVMLTNGKITLTGQTASLAEKSRAEMLAFVAGVESIDSKNLKIVPWLGFEQRDQRLPVINDTEIKDAVDMAHSHDPRLKREHVNVAVNDGRVTLSGVVENLQALRAAEQDARNTVGVIWVDNHLKVRPETKVADKTLKANVMKALKRSPVVVLSNANISVQDGRVTLRGLADTELERITAEEIAAGVNGVVAVNNRMKLHFTANEAAYSGEPDWVITENVKSELFWSPWIDHRDIKVDVRNNGVVTLTGTVDDSLDYHIAEKNARDAGARIVRNNLDVRQMYSEDRMKHSSNKNNSSR